MKSDPNILASSLSWQDWVHFAGLVLLVAVLVYGGWWQAESVRKGSWKAGHRELWRKPKRWQAVVFYALWGFILLAFVWAVIQYKS